MQSADQRVGCRSCLDLLRGPIAHRHSTIPRHPVDSQRSHVGRTGSAYDRRSSLGITHRKYSRHGIARPVPRSRKPVSSMGGGFGRAADSRILEAKSMLTTTCSKAPPPENDSGPRIPLETRLDVLQAPRLAEAALGPEDRCNPPRAPGSSPECPSNKSCATSLYPARLFARIDLTQALRRAASAVVWPVDPLAGVNGG